MMAKRIHEKQNFGLYLNKSPKKDMAKQDRNQEDNKTSFFSNSNFFSNGRNGSNGSPSTFKLNSENTCNEKNEDLIDNLILFREFYKEYLSNIFAKCYFDQINTAYAKGLSEIDQIDLNLN